AGPVVMRTADRFVGIDMTTDAEAKLRVLVKNFARIASSEPILQVSGDEVLVLQRLRHEPAHRRLGGGAGIGAEVTAKVRCKRAERVSHGVLLCRWGCYPPSLPSPARGGG